MKRLLLALLLFPLLSNAQVNIDSLKGIWDDASQADTTRLEAIKLISRKGYLFTQPDSAFYFAQEMLEFAETKKELKYIGAALNIQGISFAIRGNYDTAVIFFLKGLKLFEEIENKEGIGNSYIALGNIHKFQGEFDKAVEYYSKSLKLQEEIGDKQGIATASHNIGVIFRDQGKYDKAIEYYSKSLKIQEEIGDKNGMSNTLINIGNIYSEQGELDKVLSYYLKGLELKKEIGDKQGIANSLDNIGTIYQEKGEIDTAIDYFLKGLKIREEIGDKRGIGQSLNSIGNIYFEKTDYKEAMDYYSKSFEIQEEIGDKKGVSNALNNLGKTYQVQGDYNNALKYCNQALTLSRKIGVSQVTRDAAKCLWEINQQLGRYKESLSMYEIYITVRDSLLSEENQRGLIQQEYKYAYEKQAAADSIKAAEANKVKDALLAAEIAENNQRKQQSYFLFGGLALALIFGGFIFNRYKVTSQQKEIISEQKEEVDKAYSELEGKNQKILDSITYAKRIQSAILPPAKVVKEYLHESFIIYLPKDVVAGDFYWLESFASVDSAKASDSKDSKVFFAAADCTGHGVPGAMVSVVCNNGLNRSVREHGLTDPGKILDKTREIVVQEFEKSEEEVKDGMDIALCSLEGKTLKYAGAHNPLVIVRKDAEECEVIKPNKEPIGQFDNPQPYTTHKVELLEGDSIYLFSDGFQDQFGGPKGKKFMISRFKKLLVEVSKEPMDKQKELILKAFYDWKGNEEQVDDVCVIGVRI